MISKLPWLSTLVLLAATAGCASSSTSAPRGLGGAGDDGSVGAQEPFGPHSSTTVGSVVSSGASAGGSGSGSGSSTSSGTGTGTGSGGAAGVTTSAGSGGAPPACGAFGEPCCGGTSCSSTNLVCQNGTCGQMQSGEIGKTCAHNSDCQSGICLPIGTGQAVCTTSCTDASACVAGWTCAALIGQTSNVCQCTSTKDVCDGKDNDCNGIVDDEPATDADCKTQKSGAPYVCTDGACTCPAQDVCMGGCVDLSKTPAHCGTCGNACATGATCQAGQCACPGSPVVCGGTCVAMSTTYHLCNGACALNSDVATCGASCSACPAPVNGTATCDSTTCGTKCNAGYVPCASGCCESCATAGCAGLKYCDAASGTCLAGCAHNSQCTATQFCAVAKHTCIDTAYHTTVDAPSCPTGYSSSLVGTCSDGRSMCVSTDVPSGTQIATACAAGTTLRGSVYCSQTVNVCIPDNG